MIKISCLLYKRPHQIYNKTQDQHLCPTKFNFKIIDVKLLVTAYTVYKKHFCLRHQRLNIEFLKTTQQYFPRVNTLKANITSRSGFSSPPPVGIEELSKSPAPRP